MEPLQWVEGSPMPYDNGGGGVPRLGDGQKVDEPGFRTSGGCLRAGEFEEPSELWRDCEIG